MEELFLVKKGWDNDYKSELKCSIQKWHRYLHYLKSANNDFLLNWPNYIIVLMLLQNFDLLPLPLSRRNTVSPL